MRNKSATVVIGANFGDEGKGLITDFWAAQQPGNGLVVRFNGGAQAGHTVVTPDGLRHVFSHVGSGAFCKVPTFLSQYFVCNPILFGREWLTLHSMDLQPRVFAHRDASVTTPYDMLLNQVMENARGERRHGSCGLGFGETIERGLNPGFRLTVADLEDRRRLSQRLEQIQSGYFPQRLEQLGLEEAAGEQAVLAQADGLLEHFLEDVERFLNWVTPCDYAPLRAAEHLVFEGAQGLLLDQVRGSFPHVTRSHTGIRNALAIAQSVGVPHLDVSYVTRCYLTRHGAGPLCAELEHPPYPGIVDQTNVPNPYQGALRYSLLDIDQLTNRIMADLADAPLGGPTLSHSLAVTCLDQVGDAAMRFCRAGLEQAASVSEFLHLISENTEASRLLAAYGPSRNCVDILRG